MRTNLSSPSITDTSAPSKRLKSGAANTSSDGVEQSPDITLSPLLSGSEKSHGGSVLLLPSAPDMHAISETQARGSSPRTGTNTATPTVEARNNHSIKIPIRASSNANKVPGPRTIAAAPLTRKHLDRSTVHLENGSTPLFASFSPAAGGIHYAANVTELEQESGGAVASTQREFIVSSVEEVPPGGYNSDSAWRGKTAGVTVRSLGPSGSSGATRPRWHSHQTLHSPDARSASLASAAM